MSPLPRWTRWLGLLALPACAEPPPPPSVLVVVMDTVRADALGAYGNPRAISPQFDAVAKAGVLFTDVTAPGTWTWPCHAALFTGEPPWVSGAHNALAKDGMELDQWLHVSPMRTDLVTLADRFNAAGYRTAAYVSNALLAANRGLTRGFQETRVFEADAEVTAAAVARFAETGSPHLVFVNYMRAHSPYNLVPATWTLPHQAALEGEGVPEWARPYLDFPPGLSLMEHDTEGLTGLERYARGELKIPPEGLQLLRDLYEGEVMQVDYEVHNLIAAWIELHPTGVVVLTSDHGESFGEHGLMGHGTQPYPELTHVPLAIAAPGRLEGGQRYEGPVQLQDLYGTILQLAGLEAPGWTLVDALVGTPREGPILSALWARSRLSETVGGRAAESWRLIREGSWAALVGSGGSRELYDLSADPGMRTDLAAQRPDELRALAERAVRLIPMSDAADVGMPLSAEDAAKLQELGYVGP